jgi:hypothetical protein
MDVAEGNTGTDLTGSSKVEELKPPADCCAQELEQRRKSKQT